MPPETNFYAFCADYSKMAACLFAIQNLSDSGAFSDNPELQEMLRVFEQNTLLKLYVRAVTILNKIDGSVGLPDTFPFGDFADYDFANYDFDDGSGLRGDFSALEFTNDFLLSYLDPTNTGFSSLFQTILNILIELQRKISEISEADIISLDNALVEVLDAFEAIQAYLISLGLSPCLPPGTLYLNNSPDVYLQAAGADGADGVPAGIHLRWAFAGDLGTNHLPKGDYDDSIATPANYNQPNDYVRIYRTPYTSPTSFAIDLQTTSPSISYALKRWTYFINSTVNAIALTNQVVLTFTDADLYDQLAGQTNPATNPFDFLKAYTGIIQLSITNKTMFRVDLDMVNGAVSSNAMVKIEAQCTPDLDDVAAEKVYARQTVNIGPGNSETATMGAENIQRLSIRSSAGCYLSGFSFETYNDFLVTRNESDWTEIGSGFALNLIDDDVFARLETPDYPVDHLWPQYNEGTTVKVANYHDKWTTDNPNEPSIKTVVSEYLTLSETDPRAIMTLPDLNANPGTSGLQVSLVDILNLVSTDYHIARMLGLGSIDPVSADGQFIYKLAYSNQSALTSSAPLARSYMTLPTGKADNLLPLQPLIRPVSYGLPVVNDSVSTAFDVNGYARYGPMRAINIGREPFNDEITGYNFLADLTQADNTNIFVNGRPVNYGIKYRATADTNYVKPEITQEGALPPFYYAYDAGFPDAGVKETVAVPDNPTSLYVHLEKTTGVHYYAIYGINWFSRASVISDEVFTDDTEFPLQNRLQPPTDVTVQYIQQEDPLIFTTSVEQGWLTGRAAAFPGQDINFTRIVFNWIDIIDVTNLPGTTPAQLSAAIRPDMVNVFFDPGLPVEVQGMIRKIDVVSGQDGQLQLYTAPYTQIDGKVLSPAIDSSQFFRFNNSLLNTPQGQFVVTGLTQDTTGPIITVNKIIQQSTWEDPTSPGSYGIVQAYQLPLIGSQFSMVENLSNAENWQPVTETISLHSFADSANANIETDTDSEGNQTLNWIGGITAPATVNPLFLRTAPPDNLPPGYYRLTFTEQSLAPNPQINLPYASGNPNNNAPGTLHTAHVEWYKGWCRVATNGNNLKQLEVLRIEQTDPLSLIIYDPAYQDDPISDSSGGGTVSINFHPGYRAYLFPEPAPGTFNGANILPAANQNSKKTLVGLQTADNRSGGTGFKSSVSSPSVLLARLIVEPVKLPAPTGAAYVVRPNAIAKAAFTFDVAIPPPNPFGFKFCRTTEEDVLDALYQPLTISSILVALGQLTDDPNYNLRYADLVNLVLDTENPGHFKVYDASPNPYGFPVPDRDGLTDPGDSLDVKIQKYSLAVQDTILPLTATTPIFLFIKTGWATDNSQPTIRDANGKLLNPSSPAFNPFPMIRKYTKPDDPGTTVIRVTDYTLNASSRGLYFYAAAEVSNQLITGPLSPFTGPVTILNTTPPEPPIVRTFSIVPSAAGVVSPISIVFQVSPTAPYDNITAMRFYRTTDITLADALATMGTPVEVAVADPGQTGYMLTDTLADLANIPFGQPLYYRLASVRSIINEFNLPEEVESVGSVMVTVNLIDTVNPTAPQLTYNPPPANTLNWTTVVNKGTYYLYQQNVKGNWTLLDTDQTPQPGQVVTFQLQPLVTTDGNGNTVYNRFKVRVQNASGLFNLTDNILTV
ncbi:MAG: hypothetical protein ACHQIM_00395 [Sphingobacteriales bacterium]